jgi:multidrug efflux pump subunit AcrB
MENIIRHFESGMTRVKAAIVGAREITTPAVAASLAILAIFLPVIFMKGIIGKFFFQFGITMSVAVLLSLLEALTLAPMRLSQFMSKKKKTRLGNRMDIIMDYISVHYKELLSLCLDNRWKVIGLSALIFAISIFFVSFIRKEFVPPQDQSRFIATIQTKIDSSMKNTDEIIKKAEAIIASRPEVASYLAIVGGFGGGLVNQGSININLKQPSDRPIASPFKSRPSQQEFMGYIRNEIKKIPGVYKAAMLDLSLSGFSAKRGFPVQFSVQGSNWEKLASYSKQIMDSMNASDLVTDVDTDYLSGKPELQIIPDRNKTRDRGISVTNIANTVSAMVGSLAIGKYTDESGRRDDIRVKLLDKYNRDPQDIRRIKVRNIAGEMVNLSEVVTINEKPTLLTITRYNRERAINIFANIAPKKSQTDVMEFIQKTASKILPQNYHIVFSGSSQTFQESFQSLIIALVLGIAVAYMLLGSQFNSFLHPVTILLALPFSITGAFFALWITDNSLNIYSMIGLLLLMGIVKKNSILLVDFTNKRRISGLDVHNALLDACPVRLRPILMTSIATIAAAVPPAFAIGPGSETTRPMAIVVIGGVIFSTVLTLFVVPCAYSLLSRFESRKHEKDLHEALVSLGEKSKK